MAAMVILKIAFCIVAISALIVFYRFIAGPTLADRMIALDILTLILIASFVIYTVGLAISGRGGTFYLDVALIYALLSFTAVIAVAKYLEAKR